MDLAAFWHAAGRPNERMTGAKTRQSVQRQSPELEGCYESAVLDVEMLEACCAAMLSLLLGRTSS